MYNRHIQFHTAILGLKTVQFYGSAFSSTNTLVCDNRLAKMTGNKQIQK